MRALPNFIARRPIPAEYDLAGIIEDPNDSQFTKGDSVFGVIHTGETLSFSSVFRFLNFTQRGRLRREKVLSSSMPGYQRPIWFNGLEISHLLKPLVSR